MTNKPDPKSVEAIVEEMAQQEWLSIGDVPIAQNWLRDVLLAERQRGEAQIEAANRRGYAEGFADGKINK